MSDFTTDLIEDYARKFGVSRHEAKKRLHAYLYDAIERDVIKPLPNDDPPPRPT